MTIEQKAKAYDEALERAEKALEVLGTDKCEGARQIFSLFPELRESEDERVRKALLEMVHDTTGDELWVDYNVHKEDALAWLEKQGEQKSILNIPSRDVILSIWDLGNEWKELTNGCISTEYGTQLDYIQKHWHESEYYLKEKQREQKSIDKVEPKFKVGDSIKTANEEPLTITEITDNGYWSEDLFICNFDDAAKWELVEQKPADKVEPKCDESETKIFDAPTPFEDKLYAFVAACEFLAIPSKIEFILEHSQEILDAAREQIGKEPSSAWSKEDELVVEDIEEAVINYWHGQSQEDLLDWLKSLKTKVQPKQEWSEKDEKELEIAIDTLKESGRYDSAKWVQSLKQRIGG